MTPATLTPGSTGPVLDFLRLLWRVKHGMERRSRRMQGDLGITAPQRMVVRMVGLFPGIAAGELAELLHVDPGTLSSTLRRLADAGFVRRGADPEDGRRVRISLTPRGALLNRAAQGTVEEAVARALAVTHPTSIRRTRQALLALARELEEQGA